MKLVAFCVVVIAVYQVSCHPVESGLEQKPDVWRELHERIFVNQHGYLDKKPKLKLSNPESILADLIALNNLYNRLSDPDNDRRQTTVQRLLRFSEPQECSPETFHLYESEEIYFSPWLKSVGSYLNWARLRDLRRCIGMFIQLIESNHDYNIGQDIKLIIERLYEHVRKLLPEHEQRKMYLRINHTAIYQGTLDFFKEEASSELTNLDQFHKDNGRTAFRRLFMAKVVEPCEQYWNAIQMSILNLSIYFYNKETKALLHNNLTPEIQLIEAKSEICKPILNDHDDVINFMRKYLLYPDGKPTRLKKIGKFLKCQYYC